MAQTFDEGQLLERVDHDVAFLAETVQMLASDGPSLLDSVQRALAAADAPGVARHAHALKGMISNFCATRAHSCASDLEKLGKGGDLAAAPAAVSSMHEHLAALTTELSDFVKARA